MDKTDCTYVLVPILHNPAINPGDDIKIDLFIVGTGDVEQSQLFVGHSNPKLVGDNIGTIETALIIDGDNEILSGAEAQNHHFNTEHDLTDAGGHYSFDNRYFSQIDYNQELIENLDFPVSYLETRHNNIVPLQYHLSTDTNAKSGDYTIFLVLTYKCKCGIIHQTKEDIRIHVNDTREKLEPWPTIARIIIAVLATGSLVLTAISLAINAGLL